MFGHSRQLWKQVRITLYSSRRCSICEPVKESIERLQQQHKGIGLDVVDIYDKGNEDWLNRYKTDIPVVHVDGHFYGWHSIEEAELGQLIKEKLGD
jgi:glutaredoxin